MCNKNPVVRYVCNCCRVLTKELKFADDASLTVSGAAIQWHPGMEPAADEDGQAGSKRRLENSANQYNLFRTWFDEQGQLEMVSRNG